MITYIINTSENKTFDTEKLFSLTGYMKIVWMNSRLDEIEKCSTEIYNRQNVLGAEDFRIAVIVDFYNFRHIRLPYAETGYSKEQEKEGVDLSIYYPFIECYIIDHLFDKISQKNLIISQRDIYYVQNSAFEKLENIGNAEEQIKRVLTGNILSDAQKEEREYTLEEIKQLEDNSINEEDKQRLEYEKDEMVEIEEPVVLVGKKLEEQKTQEKKENGKTKAIFDDSYTKDITYEIVTKKKYSDEEMALRRKDCIQYKSFTLSCTDSLDLHFKMSDYPYSGGDSIKMNNFYDAIVSRTKKLKTYIYRSQNSGTTIMAAYDTLNLSLYLIEMYEQEEDPKNDGSMDDIPRIDPIRLKSLLVKSWNKVCKAQAIAKENETEYFDVEKIFRNEDHVDLELSRKEKKAKEELRQEKIKHDLERTKVRNEYTVEQLHKEIKKYVEHTELGMSKEEVTELNGIISSYLEKRDSMREQSVESDFEDEKRQGEAKTKKCPAHIVYEKIIQEKEKEISNIFKNTLKSEYVTVNYEKEKEEANLLMVKYEKIKEYQEGNPIATIIFNILICLILLVPYAVIQRRFEGIFNLPSIFLYLFHLGFFVFILLCSFTILNLIIKVRLSRIKKKMKKCLISCELKKEYSMSLFRKRYEEELEEIEEARFVIRMVKKFRDLNDQKEMHVKMHRSELESLENHLSSILNNLGIEAIVDKTINVASDFNIEEPIKSPANKVYKIFDIDTIEDLFAKKGGKE